MNSSFAEVLRKLRADAGLSQRELAERMYVTRPTVARWESGTRLPDAAMISRLSQVLGVAVITLLSAVAKSDDSPHVIMVDDSKVVLTDGLGVLEEVLPNATITGFIWPQEAIEYAKMNRIALAILDIELGTVSGLDLCRTLREINPNTNVVFLTAYAEYSLDAWNTGACGFMVKPITKDSLREQLKNLRFPFMMGGGAE